MKFKVNTDGHVTHGLEFVTKIYSPKDRAIRSAKIFLTFLIAAVVAVVIPVLHFVLVPAFLIAAFVMGYLKFKEVGYIDLSDFTCPSCHKNLNEKVLPFKEEGLSGRLRCYECRKNILISSDV